MFITRINTYHWNNGMGTPSPGKIRIRGQGSWQAKGSPGMRDTPNAEWWAYPHVTLNPGTYTITDSDSGTWSHNTASGGVGHVSMYGRSVSQPPTGTRPGLSGSAPLRLDKTAFAAKEEIRVPFTASSGYAENAWVGIIPSHIRHGSESENDQYDLAYTYLNKRTSGTLVFTAPGKGAYDFRMHDTDSNGPEVASISFTVGAVPSR